MSNRKRKYRELRKYDEGDDLIAKYRENCIEDELNKEDFRYLLEEVFGTGPYFLTVMDDYWDDDTKLENSHELIDALLSFKGNDWLNLDQNYDSEEFYLSTPLGNESVPFFIFVETE